LEKHFPRIGITSGEPAGIGPDLCLMLAAESLDAEITILGDINLLAARAKLLNINVELLPYPARVVGKKSTLSVMHSPANSEVIAGKLDANNSQYVLNMLKTAINACQEDVFDAIVTAPVHKGVMNDAGIAFTGHTEFLAEQSNTQQVVMMLVGGGLRVALATTHLPLSKVAAAINKIA